MNDRCGHRLGVGRLQMHADLASHLPVSIELSALKIDETMTMSADLSKDLLTPVGVTSRRWSSQSNGRLPDVPHKPQTIEHSAESD